MRLLCSQWRLVALTWTNPFSDSEREEERSGERGAGEATSIVDLCVHRPKSDLLRSVREEE